MKYSDEAIIEGCLAGKPALQTALYQQYGRRMMAICLRYVPNREDAEDIFHEAFVKAFKNLPNYRGGSLEGWLRRIFVTTSINFYRQNKKHRFLEDVNDKEYLYSEWPDAVSTLNVEALEKLISELPTGARVVFNLFAIEGYAHKEIAEMLNISESTSKSQFNRAKALLKDKLLVQQN